jgi:hypothetical protein
MSLWDTLFSAGKDAASAATGGVGGLAITAAGDLIGNLFNQDKSSSSLSDTDTLMSDILDKSMNTWRDTATNGFVSGMPAVQADAAFANQQPKNTIGATSTAARLNMLAKNAIDNANNNGNTALITAKTNQKNMLNTIKDAVAGNNPATISAMVNKIGVSTGAENLKLLSEANNNSNKTAATAGGLLSQGQNLLNEDRTTHYNTEVAPHLMKTQDFGSILSPLAHAGTATYNNELTSKDRKFAGVTDFLRGTGAQVGIKGIYDALFSDPNGKLSQEQTTEIGNQAANDVANMPAPPEPVVANENVNINPYWMYNQQANLDIPPMAGAGMFDNNNLPVWLRKNYNYY